MKTAARYGAQAVLYALFAVAIGYFSTRPVYRQLGVDEALVRVTVSHAAQRRQPCRQRTPEELEKLAPNMRAPLDCPRERAPVTVELELDGVLVDRAIAPPSGLAGDGPSTLYRRIVVPAGGHTVRARLSDNAAGRFDYMAEREIELRAGRVLTLDFNAARGGFTFTQ
jgi:hypothetical protein